MFSENKTIISELINTKSYFYFTVQITVYKYNSMYDKEAT